jgi:phosphoribosyl-ATP pyrophosphohydrolase
MCKKVAEEAAEVLLASKNGTAAEIVYEMADLWFHALVLLGHHTIHPHEVLRELQRRFGQPGGGKQVQAAPPQSTS